MSNTLRKATLNGAIWSMVERFSCQIVSFIVVIIMSRILGHADYGLVGLLTIFIDIAQNIVDGGVTQALIRKQDRTPTDCSTAFAYNIILSVLLYVVLYFCAPFIADFFDEPELVLLTRIISLGIVVNAFMMVQKALLNVKIDFKTQTKASLSASVVSGIVGISMAYNGFGVWSIVYYQLISQLITCVLLWVMTRWHPKLAFSFRSLKYFFCFGTSLTVAGMMHTIYKDMYLAVIGKYYGTSSLGLYTRAHQVGSFPSSNINAILQRVTYPVLCMLQDDEKRLSDTFKKFIRLISFGVFPIMIGLSILGEPIVRVLLGEKWEYAGSLLSVICLSFMWIPVDSLNLNLLQVKGRTGYFLKCEIWKKVFGVAILLGTIPMGLLMMCWGQVVRAIIDLVIDSYYTGKYFQVGFLSQVKELLPTLFYSAVMAVVVFVISRFIHSDVVTLVVCIPVGLLVYCLMAKATSSADFRELLLMIKRREQQ